MTAVPGRPFRLFAFVTIILCAAFAPAAAGQQQRGVGVRVRDAGGQTREFHLYEGSYALVIGNSEYSLGWDRLSGVKSDIIAIRDLLGRHGFKVEVEENLVSEQFERRIRKFINDYGYHRNNRLIIYYAGHGYTLNSAGDRRELGYVIPADTPLPTRDELGFRQKAVSMYAIQTFAREIQAKHALFVFDSCFSGKLFALRDTLRLTPFIVEKVDRPVRQFITAGDETQSVPDESTFRRAFVRGLEGDADRNNDTYVTGTELADYLKEAVTNYTNRRQTPQYGTINDIDLDRGDFVFAVPGNNPGSPAEAAWGRFRGVARKLLRYDTVHEPSGDLAAVTLNGKWGVIDKSGAEIVPPKYDRIEPFVEGLAVVQVGQPKDGGVRYGFIDRAGREVTPIKYSHVDSFSEGLAHVAVESNGKTACGFIDKTGKEIIPLRYDNASRFSDGLAPVSLDGKYGYINTAGRVVVPLKYNFADGFSEGLSAVASDNGAGFIDKAGKVIVPLKYDEAGSFQDGRGVVKSDGRWGFINRKGEVLLWLRSDSYQEVHLFGEGMAAVRVIHKWGFIDMAGRAVVPPKYDLVLPFSNGLAQVWFSGGGRGFIDKTGKELPFSWYSEGLGTKWSAHKVGFIDRTGKEILPVRFDEVWCSAFKKEGFVGVTLNGRKGFVDLYGNEYFDLN